MKPDDSTLTSASHERVCKEARRLLIKADALGCFPTPAEEVLRAAGVEEVDDDVLNEEGWIARTRRRISRAGGVLKQALSKVWGLFDEKGRLIFIDRTIHAVKQTFIRFHEVGHAFLPWQKKMYGLVEDCEKTIDPAIADEFEREANVFSTEVIFQNDTFIEESKQKKFSIWTPVGMSKGYGASVYSSIRQYVAKNHRACIVLVLDLPQVIPGDGFRANLRRPVPSVQFKKFFGNLNWQEYFTPDDEIGAMVPVGEKQKWSRPREMTLVDRNGTEHLCMAEAYKSPYYVFVLIHAQKTLTKTSILLARSLDSASAS